MGSYSQPLLSLFLVSVALSTLPSAVVSLRTLPKLPSIAAEKLIRDLNLFPTQAINIVGESPGRSIAAPKIVERRIRFPNLIDSGGASVGELGHHAGYYQIQNSHDARFGFVSSVPKCYLVFVAFTFQK